MQDGSKKTEIIVLDAKRSNAINIGMTKLPPKGAIKAAILKMDTTIMNREGIEVRKKNYSKQLFLFLFLFFQHIEEKTFINHRDIYNIKKKLIQYL